MKFVPYPVEYLRIGHKLPMPAHACDGTLLLAAGSLVANQAQLEELVDQRPCARDRDVDEWQRRVNAAMDTELRRGSALKDIVRARPAEQNPASAADGARTPMVQRWLHLVQRLETALRLVGEDSDWRERVLAVHADARALSLERPDASLYCLVFEAGNSYAHYSCHHALLTLLIVEQAAAALQWPEAWLNSVGRSALLMNVAMQRLQDHLAASRTPPTPAMRAEIDAHGEVGARLLAAAGLDDPLCLEVVRLHHVPDGLPGPLSALPAPQQLARLLRRADIFGAKISRRINREPMSPVQAAREACLGADGQPDEIGSALLRALGIYPPGSFVELANGERGIVMARGRRANLPLVASLVSSSGSPIAEPILRDSILPRFAVKSAVLPGQVRVHPNHERLLALR